MFYLSLICNQPLPIRNPRWSTNGLYVSKVLKPVEGIKVNKKKGASVSVGKNQGSWRNAFEVALELAGWTDFDDKWADL